MFSGVFEAISKDTLKEFVVDLGARVTSAVSGKTSYLIVGFILEDDRKVEAGSKYRAAKAKGIEIMTESKFEEYLKKKFDNEFFSFDHHELWNDVQASKAKTDGTQIQKATVNKAAPGSEKKNMLLTEKYKPVSTSDLVGNKAQVKSILEWLKDWDDVHVNGNKKAIQKKGGFGGWASAPNLNAKAALISGPPGIGKTSTARIISKELGFEVVEMNASDTRNKKVIESMIGELSSNKSMDYFLTGKKQEKSFTSNLSKKSVIIMDEVDGCGGGDRGGISALIKVIKITKTPIICICNDHDNRKLVSLINNCFDVKFIRPREKDIVSRIRQIARAEGLDINDKAIELLITQSGNDIRQVITQLQVMLTTSKSLSFKDVKDKVKNISKDKNLMINNFQAAHKLLNSNEFRDMDYRERMDMFFIDYDFVPLLVQENYLKAFESNWGNGMADLKRMANAASYISMSDTVQKRVRGNMEWTLLQDLGFTSSIAPCHYSNGNINFPGFPQWLGKNSKTLKSKRLVKELKKAMGHRANCDRKTILIEYIPLIFDEIYKHLKNEEVKEAIEVLDSLNISNDQFKEHVVDLMMDPKANDKLKKISTKVKSALTRAYNATHQTSLKAKKKPTAAKEVEKDLFDPDREEEEQVSEEEDEQVEFDIEEIKKKTKGKGKSKAKGKSKGKKKK